MSQQRANGRRARRRRQIGFVVPRGRFSAAPVTVAPAGPAAAAVSAHSTTTVAEAERSSLSRGATGSHVRALQQTLRVLPRRLRPRHSDRTRQRGVGHHPRRHDTSDPKRLLGQTLRRRAAGRLTARINAMPSRRQQLLAARHAMEHRHSRNAASPRRTDAPTDRCLPLGGSHPSTSDTRLAAHRHRPRGRADSPRRCRRSPARRQRRAALTATRRRAQHQLRPRPPSPASSALPVVAGARRLGALGRPTAQRPAVAPQH